VGVFCLYSGKIDEMNVCFVAYLAAQHFPRTLTKAFSPICVCVCVCEWVFLHPQGGKTYSSINLIKQFCLGKPLKYIIK